MTNTNDIATNANAFASTFYFFADTQGNAKKIKRACKPTHPDSASVQCKLGRTQPRLPATLKDDSAKHEQTEKRHKSQPHI